MPEREVIRDFTKARKFPNLIGRTPDGKRLLGGPYTISQFVGGGVAAIVLYLLGDLWMVFGPIANAILYFGLVGALVFVLGKMRLGGRSPVSVLQGLLTAVSAPRRPPVNGRAVRGRTVFVHAGGVVHPAPAVLTAEPEPISVAAMNLTVVQPGKAAIPARYAAALGRNGASAAIPAPAPVVSPLGMRAPTVSHPREVPAATAVAAPKPGAGGLKGLMVAAKSDKSKEGSQR